jgi:hypothetical protein
LAIVLTGGLAAFIGALGGGTGCTLLLDTSANPQSCRTDADCVRFPNAACDNAHRICVPKFPYASGSAGNDGGGTGGVGGAGGCGLSFDNSVRIGLNGPDGGLRPLPEAGQ